MNFGFFFQQCEEPYYGGRIECGDANHVEVKPEELICRKCASTVRIICSNQEHEQYWVIAIFLPITLSHLLVFIIT